MVKVLMILMQTKHLEDSYCTPLKHAEPCYAQTITHWLFLRCSSQWKTSQLWAAVTSKRSHYLSLHHKLLTHPRPQQTHFHTPGFKWPMEPGPHQWWTVITGPTSIHPYHPHPHHHLLCCSEASTQSWGGADEAATHLMSSALTRTKWRVSSQSEIPTIGK